MAATASRRQPAEVKAARHKANATLTEEVAWGYYVCRRLDAYGAVKDRTPEDAASLRELRIRCRGNLHEICRRIRRAFDDPARVKAGITLESIVGDFRELAA